MAESDVEIRAAIDAETVRGLQLINGGMSSGLIALLPTVLRDPDGGRIGTFMIVGAFCGAIGLVLAVVHNRLRRKCSLEHKRPLLERQPPYTSKWLVRRQSVSGEPKVCTQSMITMWLSLVFFILGASIVAIGFFLGARAPRTPAPVPVIASSAASPMPTAEANRAAYESEERCGREAREWFKQFFGTGTEKAGDSRTDSSYENHFNAKMNKCFALLSITGSITDPKTNSTHMSRTKTLADVNENREVGTFFTFINPPPLTHCTFAGEPCASEADWDALAKPYLER